MTTLDLTANIWYGFDGNKLSLAIWEFEKLVLIMTGKWTQEDRLIVQN